MPGRTGYVTPQGRPPVPALDLVAQMRRSRGRLTRRELCVEVGLEPNVPAHLTLIDRLCRDYDITTRDPPPRRVPKHRRGGEVREAKAALKREIALARAEAPFAAPFRCNDC